VFPIRVTLASLPPGKAAPNLNEAEPLGERDAVTARLKELLPGISFDEQGRGVFQRPSYTLRFTLDDPALMVVEMDRAEGFVAIARVVAKTGWRAIDAEALTFLDVEASRSAGGVVAEVSTVDDQSTVRDLSGNSGFRWAKRIAVALFAGAVLWGVWQYAASRPDTMTPTPGQMANTQRMSDEVVRWAFERARRRQQLTKAIAPEFRNNPVVVQLFEFLVASVDYRASIGMGRYATPEALSDQANWLRMQIPPPLPAAYGDGRRDGYQFEFLGQHCGPMPNNMSAPQNDCDQFVYLARPVDDEESLRGRSSFALFSEDFRIHYRTDGELPTLEDPTVDNAAPEPARAASPGLFTRVIEWFIGKGAPSQAPIAAAEASAIQDLRAVAQAEQAFSIMMNGERYTTPEVLADPQTFSRLKMPPLLPGYFVQPLRMGYTFEFTGNSLTVPLGYYDWISPNYGTFVYIARPTEGGPPGRRTFALYPDGIIFATTEDRVPTRSDTPLGP
jgi:hypothetical protein